MVLNSLDVLHIKPTIDTAKKTLIYWITVRHIHMKWQKIEEVVSSYTYTQMYPTSKNQRHAEEQVVIFSSAQNIATTHQY